MNDNNPRDNSGHWQVKVSKLIVKSDSSSSGQGLTATTTAAEIPLIYYANDGDGKELFNEIQGKDQYNQDKSTTSNSMDIYFRNPVETAVINNECQLDKDGVNIEDDICTSPKQYTNLSPGEYTFRVIAYDRQSLKWTEADSISWTVLQQSGIDTVQPSDEGQQEERPSLSLHSDDEIQEEEGDTTRPDGGVQGSRSEGSIDLSNSDITTLSPSPSSSSASPTTARNQLIIEICDNSADDDGDLLVDRDDPDCDLFFASSSSSPSSQSSSDDNEDNEIGPMEPEGDNKEQPKEENEVEKEQAQSDDN